ncbi:MAG TPA: farnesyl diphosphate synthase [Candidatus Binatia bacterium]|nr:farnesyl diphosphate synthase [Candidatus Binatia bacterium]
MTIEEYLRLRASEVDRALGELVRERRGRVEPRLLEAMEYSLTSPGKRIRPILLLAAAEALGADPHPLLPFACAAEMVHAYSLIHDDLPAMDDDDLRRGRPTNHKVFGEAVAILAGDALLTEAFAVLSADGGLSAERRVAAIRELAVAAGAEGMVGGQTADILAEGAKADLSRVESIHRRKTGALLRACVRIGGVLAGADALSLASLSAYGEAIGLAFQIADDLLDELGDTQATGKAAARDRERGKSTYPAALGVECARQSLRELLDQGLAALGEFGSSAEPLRGIARRIVERAL